MSSSDWNAPEWARRAVFYEIFPERFCNGDPANDPPGTVPWESAPTRENFFGGDLAGIRARLDYLQALGIDAIYSTPFFEARTNHRYDTSDYLAIDPAAGTSDDFRALVRDLKQRGMHIILDAVFNHCGDGFARFQHARDKGPASPYWDWFIFDDSASPPAYQTCGGAPFLPKLHTGHPDVRAYLLDVTRHWLAEGTDGWRLDVPWKVPMDFWRAFRQAALEVNPDAFLVAEEWRSAWPWQTGDTVHGVMNYRLRNAILDYCAWDHMDAEDFDYELRVLRDEHGLATPYHMTLLGSHDTPRILTLCGENINRLLLAVVFQMTYIGIPMVYYGDEVGMVGENDPACRAGMVWDTGRQNQRILATHRLLINLRHTHAALTHGTFEPLAVFNGLYAYRRVLDDDVVVVVLNPREARDNVRISLCGGTGRWTDHLTRQTFVADAGILPVEHLPAQAALVLTPTPTR